MKTRVVMIAACGSVLLAAHAADAGMCADELKALEQSVASSDAQSGATTPDVGGTQAPTVTEQPGDRVGAEEDSSPPTVAERAEAGRDATVDRPDVNTLLEDARMMQEAGNEAGCLVAVEDAKKEMESR